MQTSTHFVLLLPLNLLWLIWMVHSFRRSFMKQPNDF